MARKPHSSKTSDCLPAVLETLRDLVEQTGTKSQVAMVTALLEAIEPGKTCGKSVDRIVDDQHADATSDMLRFCNQLNSLKKLIETCTKKNVPADLGRFITLVEEHHSMPIKSILSRLREEFRPSDDSNSGSTNEPTLDEFIKAFATELKEKLGSDEFDEAFGRMKSHKRVSREVAVAIAQAMGGRLPDGAAKKRAIDQIKDRHESLMDFHAKGRAMGGRSAA